MERLQPACAGQGAKGSPGIQVTILHATPLAPEPRAAHLPPPTGKQSSSAARCASACAQDRPGRGKENLVIRLFAPAHHQQAAKT